MSFQCTKYQELQSSAMVPFLKFASTAIRDTIYPWTKSFIYGLPNNYVSDSFRSTSNQVAQKVVKCIYYLLKLCPPFCTISSVVSTTLMVSQSCVHEREQYIIHMETELSVLRKYYTKSACFIWQKGNLDEDNIWNISDICSLKTSAYLVTVKALHVSHLIDMFMD